MGLIDQVGRAQNDEAQRLLRKAIEVEPGYARAHAVLGWAVWWAALCYWREDMHEAHADRREDMHEAHADSFAGIYTAIHGLALLGARRFADALPFLRASVAAFAGYPGHYNTLISCCGHLGLDDEARAFIEARNKVGPPLRAGALRGKLRGFAHCDVFVEGLLKAGVPE